MKTEREISMNMFKFIKTLTDVANESMNQYLQRNI